MIYCITCTDTSVFGLKLSNVIKLVSIIVQSCRQFSNTEVWSISLRLSLRLGLSLGEFSAAKKTSSLASKLCYCENNTACQQTNCVTWFWHELCFCLTLFFRLQASCVIVKITQLACKRAVVFCRKLTQSQTQSEHLETHIPRCGDILEHGSSPPLQSNFLDRVLGYDQILVISE